MAKYNFNTRSNFELLRYCALHFTKCWLAMNTNGSWIACSRKPKLYPNVGMWSTSKVENYHKCYFTKLPKRPASFAQYSLKRDYIVHDYGGYYD